MGVVFVRSRSGRAISASDWSSRHRNKITMFYHFRRLHRAGQSEMKSILECGIHNSWPDPRKRPPFSGLIWPDRWGERTPRAVSLGGPSGRTLPRRSPRRRRVGFRESSSFSSSSSSSIFHFFWLDSVGCSTRVPRVVLGVPPKTGVRVHFFAHN